MSVIDERRPQRYDSQAVAFAPHAVEQFNRRYLRRLNLDAAERELHRLAAEHGYLVHAPPPWAHKQKGRAIRWLVIDEPKACFPVYGDAPSGDALAGTCITPHTSPVGATVRWVK